MLRKKKFEMLNEAKITDQIGKTPVQLETYKTVAPESEGRFEITINTNS